MQSLVNAFSVLELDAEDDQIPALSTFSKPDATASSSSKTGFLDYFPPPLYLFKGSVCCCKSLVVMNLQFDLGCYFRW